MRRCVIFVSILFSALLVAPLASHADGTRVRAETDSFAIARGGQYYDKWWAVIDADAPKQTHTAYPAAGKKQGAATWRCKECHGWDYKGANGAYAAGSHATGIKGIRAMAGVDPKQIANIIRTKPHNYSKALLPDKALAKLALFVSKGQIEMARFIDSRTKKAKGDRGRGARFYQTVCANCHGFDGKKINFKSEKKPEFIGTIAQENPWEFLHKVRHGQPGQVMPALIALDVQDAVDITAYAQTLSVK